MKKMSIIALLFAAVLATSYSVSGTYAKYVSTFTGTDTARVAKWAFEINDTAVTDTFTFDLFKTVNDTDGTSLETDVTSANGDRVIAPGTTGEFAIKLENLSEVEAKYSIDYTVTNGAGIPVEFSIDGGEWKTDLEDISVEDAIRMNKNGGDTITIKWRWLFEETGRITNTDDEDDTALGKVGTDTITVKAAVTVTQID